MRNVVLFSLLCWLLCSQLCSGGGDTLNLGKMITQDSENNLVSEGNEFELGFFSLPIGSEKKYLGIWYHNLEPQTVVWVANRDNPVKGSNGVFQIAEDGNLVVEDASEQVWSSALEGSSSKNRTLKLLDSGNLVLMDDDSGMRRYLWQSFQHPTHTFLPGMKMDANLTLTSWRNDNDPGSGSFTFKLLQKGSCIVNNQSQLYWVLRTDSDRLSSQEISPLVLTLLGLGVNATSTSGNSSSRFQEVFDFHKSRLIMNHTGQVQFLKWENEDTEWFLLWSGPGDKCDTHNYCGSFSSCDKSKWKPCKCLPGFTPRLPYDQYLGGRQGCVRKSKTCSSKGMMFLNLKRLKVGYPDEAFPTETEAECRSQCLKMCPHSQCQAYSYNSYNRSNYDRSSFSCWIWTRDLLTLEEQQDSGGDLSILIRRSDIASTAKSCAPCGTYVIPYPLSTGPNCGDPMYSKFNCDYTKGQVSFMMSGGKSYRVTWIDEGARKFYIQTNDSDSDHCDSSSSYQSYKPSSPFNVTNWCFSKDEIEVTWLPAPQPTCNKSRDCNHWLHSTCTPSNTEGVRRCLCNSNYLWNTSSYSCIQESSSHSTNRLPLILTAILVGTIILACAIGFAYVRRKKIAQKLDKVNIQVQESLYGSERHVKGLIGLGSLEENNSEGIEVPYYTFRSILAATENFSESNKLGRGGYGPVYKGRFPGGQDIAVKRLSAVSTQGLKEFKNEVVLIAKLQHRNLVRLRGYCMKGEEKILLYEYMPNKSLDSFIFDRTRTLLLNWQMRFDIILGIARGLLYLHQDSRLRVIHRDLKTSNILLDEEMNPKISDFGLAKIFGGKETEASTEKVVGTFGYMAPEYALDGFFSVKSDVFSFGVVLLEILSGKRNTGFYECKQISSLLGYAWRLWTENKLLDLMDQSIGESCNENQFMKCALIGLLCVQDEPGDRPTMSNVVTMLDSETATIPIPTQPTFFARKPPSISDSGSSSKQEIISLEFDSSYQHGR
ncbi:G-type lectin S-receptor-like serine/threonine-protein kinase At4g03230 [Lotus japonicus]|uniref:G-type lectin S-receptor-like serine/threonine-protein kinase At4g03230 n=1 Tax=Lotus japonicus TaxID=34305 RepID=UPI0025904CEC|nr:G-type lectin S-receptor-like serine/threonine-protein kinase At4g03230 [Lotus japonicus]